MQELAPLVLTPDGAQLPADGGVLVGWTWETRGAKRDTDPSQPPEWQLGAATKAQLAPGVTVYRPKARTGKFAITGKDGAAVASFGFDASAAAVKLAAPTPTAIRRSEIIGRRGRSIRVDAELASPPPPDAIAVVVYKQRTAIDFAQLDRDAAAGADAGADAQTKAKTITIHRDAGRCAFNPKGIEAPAGGDEITFAWVDRFGRLSKPSKAIKVTATVDR